MASPQNSLKLNQTNPYPTQNQNLDWVFRGARDDLNRTRKDHGPQNIAILRHIALNLIQKSKPPNTSISRFRKNLGWNNDLMQKTILNFYKINS